MFEIQITLRDALLGDTVTVIPREAVPALEFICRAALAKENRGTVLF